MMSSENLSFIYNLNTSPPNERITTGSSVQVLTEIKNLTIIHYNIAGNNISEQRLEHVVYVPELLCVLEKSRQNFGQRMPLK